MKQPKLIRKIEELSMNALPALQTQMDDGWILRYANGYTKRANSINPLYPSYDEDVIGKIGRSETAFTERNIQVAYKITPLASPDGLDHTLEALEYSIESRTSVQALSLTEMEAPNETNVLIYNEMPESRFHDFCRLNNIQESNQSIFRSVLDNIIPTTCFIFVADEEESTLACGLGVLEDGYIGLFNIATDVEFRNQGYGTKLVRNLLYWGKENGAKNAYLQVVLTNDPARNLYARLGFKELYRYWFRVKR
ncbi:GNAT family N-acetyltransferase [Peribacillus sp. NPDC097295]|uniref:GNAT family N-acetyltransferase n=1 Tax=Peribacillus sp. NPDC097295 TaxID=3364402 RepID=UPI0038105173